MEETFFSRVFKSFFCVLWVVFSTQMFAAGQHPGYATLQNDTFKIGNNQIERSFLWNNGNLITIQLVDKTNARTYPVHHNKPDFELPNETAQVTNGTFKSIIVPSNGIHASYFAVEVSFSLGTVDVKRIYRLYNDVCVIALDTYLKGNATHSWLSSTESVADQKNIERVEAGGNAGIYPVLDRVALGGKHWKLEAVELFDVTDRNNNLVQTTRALSYKTALLRGNLLFANNSESGNGIFFLKEAPCSFVQLAYPNADFVSNFGELKVVGLGMDAKDLFKGEWQKTYSSVLGLYRNNQFDCYVQLHKYQKQIRLHKSKADEAIMMNTWGDRGQDKKVNETFCLNELQAAAKLGITHYQIDDGWQSGKSANSAFAGGSFKSIWQNPNYWKPDSLKYPNGLQPIVDAGKKLGINICLWFNPSIENDFADWEKDANALLWLYHKYGIKTFKIDGVQIRNRLGEQRLRLLFDKVVSDSKQEIVFNLDVTAGRRGGYYYFNEYGNVFLENRYTDWQNYYPYWTLRNLWMLSKYVPAPRLQIEFLNKWRNQGIYGSDKFAPKNYAFDYLFATTMAASPLAWMEATGLPKEAFTTSTLINKYKTIQHSFHEGTILPIGDEPSGTANTGLQSIQDKKGYFLLFREDNADVKSSIKVHLPVGSRLQCKDIVSDKQFQIVVSKSATIPVEIPTKNGFLLIEYTIID